MNTRKDQLAAFNRLLDIMDELREKCPWDKKQTLESLRHLTIEETYELADAILDNDLQEIKKELARFDDKITRIEVHLGDENGDKFGKNDKKCMIEARMEKKNPIAVTAHSDTPEKAFYEAVEKIKRSLSTTLEKMREH